MGSLEGEVEDDRREVKAINKQTDTKSKSAAKS